jgi:hypothetical protein
VPRSTRAVVATATIVARTCGSPAAASPGGGPPVPPLAGSLLAAPSADSTARTAALPPLAGGRSVTAVPATGSGTLAPAVASLGGTAVAPTPTVAVPVRWTPLRPVGTGPAALWTAPTGWRPAESARPLARPAGSLPGFPGILGALPAPGTPIGHRTASARGVARPRCLATRRP